MISRFFLVIILCCCMGCSKKLSKTDLIHLNGYWEINQVIFSDGSSKQYNVNSTIDFIELKDTIGYIKKVQPRFDGSYKVTNNTESFSIIEKEGIFKMYFKNNLNERMEQLTTITPTTYTIKNKDNTTYKYRRYTPINIE